MLIIIIPFNLEQSKSKISSEEISIDKPHRGKKLVKTSCNSCERPSSNIYNQLSERLNNDSRGEMLRTKLVDLNSDGVENSLENESKLKNQRAYEKHSSTVRGKMISSIKEIPRLRDIGSSKQFFLKLNYSFVHSKLYFSSVTSQPSYKPYFTKNNAKGWE